MIHIACCTDENYAFNFTVIAQSVLEHHAKEEVVFHLFHSHLTNPTTEKIKQYVAEKRITVLWHMLDDAIFASLPQIGYFTIAMYYRLLIPELLQTNISKVLYLDMDVIVQGKLDEFWNIDLSGKGAAVIEDGAPIHLGEHGPARYFNSGVLLMNLDYWREHSVKEKAIDFMVRHREILRFPDQDALNVVLEKAVTFMPEKWNYHLNLDKRFLKRALRGQVSKDEAPVIIHFNQKVKPWMYHCKHPYSGRYWKLLKRTTFRDYRMKNKTIATILFYFTPKPLRTTFWPRLSASLPQN